MDAILSKLNEELVAIGAAIAANCEPCLNHHVQKAREAGITDDQLRAAVTIAQRVKETPARLVLAQAKRLLGDREGTPAEAAAGCCR